MSERLVMTATVKATSQNISDIKNVQPNAHAQVGNDVKIRYSVDVMYIGEVYSKLQSMKRLGANGDNCKATQTYSGC